jgi:hypothetical protein
VESISSSSENPSLAETEESSSASANDYEVATSPEGANSDDPDELINEQGSASSIDRPPLVEPDATVTTPVLVVRPDAVVGDDPNVVTSLEAAFQRVADEPEITTVELHFHEWQENPLTLHLPNDSDTLTIKAGEGYEPLLIFRPHAADLAPERPMLNIIGGRVEFVGVHFRVELPYDMADGWSLFHLNHVNDVRLVGCTMTVSNPLGNPAVFFSVHGTRQSGMENPPDEIVTETTPQVRLEACVARGQATLIRANEGLPFRLTWKQGCLATSEYLAEAGGLTDPSQDGVVRIRLTNVTASMTSGMVRLEIGDRAPSMPELGLTCNQCVFVHDESMPLIEYRNVASVERAINLFRMDGMDNFYPSTYIRWRIDSANEATREFLFEDKDQPWYNESFAAHEVRWRAPLPDDRDVDTQMPQDYLLEAGESEEVGFNPSLLPTPREPGGAE